MQDSTKGTIAAITAFSLWGILPIYWKFLEGIPLLETTAHRALWTLIILVTILFFQNKLSPTLSLFRNRKAILVHALAAAFLASNWLLYVWSTQNERIIEGALGYYINPFLYILLGKLFFGEKFNRTQLVAIIVAATGVGIQFLDVTSFPWVAIGLACTFAGYGMIRKKSPVGPFSGLTLETSCMLVPAVLYLLFLNPLPSSFGKDGTHTILLICAGAATAVPLLCFARGARSIDLSLIGIFQFIGPTGQLFIGWLMYQEPMPPLRMLSFALIWTAIGIYIFAIRSKAKSR